MQEELKLKIKRTAKKLAAVGTGALVAGMTLTGAAFAADLSDLPAPIVSSGAFDAYVVVGTNAATIDVAGAIELSTAFGQLATTTTGAEGQATLQVEVFAGETLTALDVDTAIVNTYHSDETWAALGKDSDLTVLNDIIFTAADDEAYNSSIEITIDDDYVELTRSNFALKINESTDTYNVVQLNLSTNRTAINHGFFEGDSINWFGVPYEIVEINIDGNVTLGNTETVTAYKDESFTIGGQTFTLKQVADATVVIIDASDNVEYINSTYATIGTIQLKTASIQNVPGYEKVVFETIESSYKFAVGDIFPVNDGADEFIVDSMSVNTTDSQVDSPIILRNNVSYMLGAKSAKASIVEGLDFTYTDNTEDKSGNEATTTPSTGAAVGQINITETGGVTNYIYGNYSDGGEATFNTTAFNLPGMILYNFTDEEFPTSVTAISTGDTGYGDAETSTNRLYLYDEGANKYELAVKPMTSGNMSYYVPKKIINQNYTDYPLSGSEWDYQVSGDSQLWVNHTTPSGVKVAMIHDAVGDYAYIQLKVAAITINVDSTDYYGRKEVAWSNDVYSQYGAKVDWSGAFVTVDEPNGQQLKAIITFDATSDNATFTDKAHLTFGGQVITAIGTDTVARNQETTHGSVIAYMNSTDLSDISFSVAHNPDIALMISTPQKEISVGVGSLANQTKTLDTDATTDTYLSSEIFGNTTVTLVSGAGSSESISKITPGFAKLDADITTTTLAKPVVLVGGSSVNTLVKNLIDNGLMSFEDLIAQGEGHAQIDLVENAFNSQTALVIAGYSGMDTLMAGRAVAGALLNGQPFGFATHNVTTLLLNTGVTAVNDVAVVS